MPKLHKIIWYKFKIEYHCFLFRYYRRKLRKTPDNPTVHTENHVIIWDVKCGMHGWKTLEYKGLYKKCFNKP